MELPASLHPKDALTGLVVAGAALALLAVARQVAGTRAPDGRPGAGSRSWFARWAGFATWFVTACGAAATAALALAVGRGLIRDVAAGAALAAALVALAAGLGWHRLALDLGDDPADATRWTGAVVVVSAFGVWMAVPDTEAAVTVLATLVPFVIAAVAIAAVGADRALGGRPAAAAWCVLALPVAWAAAWGSSARDAALPGGLACFGAALVVPWVAAARPGVLDVRWLLPAHALAVLAAARWAARAATAAGGVVRSLVVLGLLATVAAIGVSVGRRGRGHPRPSPPAERPR